jgi:MFS family permease
LAFAISELDGVRNIAGWRWIFLIEGCVTVAVGLAMPYAIPKSSEKAGWLTDEEKRFIDCRLRLAGVRATSEEVEKEIFSWRHLADVLLDWKVNLGVIMAWANAGPSSAFSYTMPEILTGLGYTSTIAQLMTIPPYFCGGVSSYLVGRIADRFSWRFPFIVGPMCVLLTGLCIMFGFANKIHNHVAVMYFGAVLSQIGIFPLLPGISAWTGNNIASDRKRSLGVAWLLAGGNLASKFFLRFFHKSIADSLCLTRLHWNECLPPERGTGIHHRILHVHCLGDSWNIGSYTQRNLFTTLQPL